jgi:hypothetical protein
MQHHVIPFHSWKVRINPQATRNDRDYNAPDNWVNLTTEQHAQAHGLLFELHGNEYDKIAQRMILGQIGKEEASRLARVHSNKLHKTGKKHSPTHSAAQSAGQLGRKKAAYCRPPWNKGLKTGPLSETHKANLSGRIPWNKKVAT